MATIVYNITAGDPPFTAELYRGAVLIDTKVWNSKGQFHFTNVPDGSYTIVVSDTVGCSSQFDAVVACDTTTTTVLPTTTTTTTYFCPEGCIEYGLLYNHYSVTDERNISSSDDWIVPTIDDWNNLFDYLGISLITGQNSYSIIDTGSTYWFSETGTNTTKLTIRGAGYRLGYNPSYDFKQLKSFTCIWASTTVGAEWGDEPDYVYIDKDVAVDGHNETSGYYGNTDFAVGHSVRLVKKNSLLAEGECGIYIGNDSTEYKTICINGNEWMRENLAETLFRTLIPIPHISDRETWMNATEAGMCAYDNNWNYVGCELIEPTTTTTTTVEPTTTTTTTAPTLSSCDMIISSDDAPYLYSVSPYKFQALYIPDYKYGNDIANTANKLWTIGDDDWNEEIGFYTEIWEYDITYAPFTASFNRIITLPYYLGQGLCAIDDTTLIFTHYVDADPWNNPSEVCTADISGATPIVTKKFDLEYQLGVMSMMVSGDFLLTTGANPKFIVTTENDVGGDTWIYQYDWATGDIEIKKSLGVFPDQLQRPFGLAVQNGKLYLFDARSIIPDTADVYEISLTYPYDRTFIEQLDSTWVSGATQQPSCIDIVMLTTTTSTTIEPTTTTTTVA